MTAEIAIINSYGLALAADSAVTIGGDRVWKNSNKLFHLASCADVGVMFFGNGSHCGLPWEVIIKQYRRHLGKVTFPKLTDYSSDFLLFLNQIRAPDPLQNDINLYSIMLNIVEQVKPSIDDIKGKTAKRKKFIERMNQLVEEVKSESMVFGEYPRDRFSQRHSVEIRGFLEDEIDMMITKPVLTAMITACYNVTIRAIPSGWQTGVVFAGFGEDELLPVLEEICVDGTLDGVVRAWTQRTRNLNTSDAGATIMPFAQSDITHLFVEGLLPEYIEFMAGTLKATLDRKSTELIHEYVPQSDRLVEAAKQEKSNEAMAESFLEQFKNFRGSESVQKMMRVVGSLPKEEMAAMAEALVEITSLKRKMDSSVESVGGPVDVAIVSKSDGFIWMKRKHYFDIELNQDFMQRRYERYSGVTNDDK